MNTTFMKDLHFQQLVPEIAQSQPAIEQSPANPPSSSKTKGSSTFTIGWILRGGVILSATITCIGMLLLTLKPGGLTEHQFETFPHTLNQVWVGLLGLHPQAVI